MVRLKGCFFGELMSIGAAHVLSVHVMGQLEAATLVNCN